ncbi:hypothetical protein E2A64_10315 [Pseudohoeflea suaedae]|uniref:Uncharacterized protein n=1 Tax=Pseudohoeflea suaedae TaxID=877384 RepID=A0A4R5PJ91_9HYPH|nr:hypothetical protein [Pseudohoeflea suaedae]TDH35721.1 hypothetical protein E2A64_10315 [Pseudohoeflea suaedae]
MRKFFFLPALLVIVITAYSGGSDKPGSKSSNCSDTTAFVMSQKFVRRALKAPSTAEFPYMSDDGVMVSKQGNCRFTVHGYVDAQNGFGAQIRTRYMVDVSADAAGKSWSSSNLTLF